MRLAFDASVQGAREPTGVERSQHTLIRALARLPETPELVLAGARRWPEELAALADRGATLLPRAGAWPAALWRELELPRALSRLDVDVLHAPYAAVPLRAPCPVVATIHELPWASRDAEARATGDKRIAHRGRTALAVHAAARIVCVSERTRRHLLGLYPEAAERVVVVPHGVDPRFVPGAGRHAHVEPYVLAVGRLRAKKNLMRLLEAFAIAPAAAGHRLVLAGPDGDASTALRARAAAPDLRGRVEFPGHVDEDALLSLYQGAACLCHPALLEGFGLPVLEAMACGVPVLASRQGAVDAARGEAAEVFDGHDVAAFAAALEAVLGSPDHAAALAERGRTHAARCSAEHEARAVLAVCADCVAEARAS